MKRKIIKQGHNTLTVTLPSKWVKEYNIKPGDEIDMSELNNGLFLGAEKKHAGKKITFAIADMDVPTIWQHFMSVYREGYDEITVKFNPSDSLHHPYKFFTRHALDPRFKKYGDAKTANEAVQGFVSRFIGFEIFENGRDYIKIKSMGVPTSKEFDNSLRRVFFILQHMADDTVTAMRIKNTKLLQNMHDVDINLDKFHDYCIRVLNKKGIQEPKKIPLFFTTLYLVELLADEFKNIAKHLMRDFPGNNFRHLEMMGVRIKESIDHYCNLFYKYDTSTVQTLSSLDQRVYDLAKKLYRRSNDHEKEVLHHFRMIKRYLNALLELRIQMEF